MLFRKIRLAEKGWYHSFNLPDGRRFAGMQSVEHLENRLAQFHLPADLTGARVLDIGAWDGWFSFEMERRGAQVTAVDSIDSEGFRTIHRLLESRVEYRQCSVYDLDPKELGTFDIVLFLGVLYHLRHPIIGLERVCALTNDLALIESYVTGPADDEAPPNLQFYEGVELRGQFDNWFGPNVSALLALCRTSGFVKTSLRSVLGDRAHVECRRHWPSSPGSDEEQERPALLAVSDAESMEETVHPDKSSHVSFYFTTSRKGLRPNEVYPEVSGFAVHPALLAPSEGDGWMAVGRLPPGLQEGEAEAVIRLEGAAPSRPRRLRVRRGAERTEAPANEAVRAEGLSIVAITDGRSWRRDRADVPPGLVSIWVEGLPTVSDATRPAVFLDAEPLDVTYVGQADEAGRSQINAAVPSEWPAGPCEIRVEYAGSSVRGRIEVFRP